MSRISLDKFRVLVPASQKHMYLSREAHSSHAETISVSFASGIRVDASEPWAMDINTVLAQRQAAATDFLVARAAYGNLNRSGTAKPFAFLCHTAAVHAFVATASDHSKL